MDYRLISYIEKVGCVDAHGHHLYGTSALLYTVHRPISSFSKKEIEAGRAFVQRYLDV